MITWLESARAPPSLRRWSSSDSSIARARLGVLSHAARKQCHRPCSSRAIVTVQHRPSTYSRSKPTYHRTTSTNLRTSCDARTRPMSSVVDRLSNIVLSDKSASMAGKEEVFMGSIDQGTTSSRFLIFNTAGEPVAVHQEEFTQIYPNPG